MNRTPGELKQMLERFEAVLRGAKVKLTPQRREIYRETARTGDHPRIETIYRNVRRKMPSVSLDTVYRTLDLFRELGLVRTVRPFPDRVRFDANTAPHHHFVCTACGLTRDFNDPNLDSLKVPAAARALGRVESTHVEVRGLCPACAAGKNANRSIGLPSYRPDNKFTRRD
jgi:Fur family peroxide stress response transcriptional regulator